MSFLLSYLSTRFHDPKTPVEEIQKVFLETFGVRVRYEDDGGGGLFMFSYDQILAKMKFQMVRECRGIIFRRSIYRHARWKIESRPFEKFFNIGEGLCPLNDEEVFQHFYESNALFFAEKYDGSMLQVWYDFNKEYWRVSTTNTITPIPISEGKTLEDLFWETQEVPSGLLKEYKKRHPYLQMGETHMFELCTKHNMVVNNYGRDRLVHLASVDLEDGQSFGATKRIKDFFKDTARMWRISPENGPALAKHLPVFLATLVESYDDDSFGDTPEGFVVYRLNMRTWSEFSETDIPFTTRRIPVGKIKFEEYLKAHRKNTTGGWFKDAVKSIYAGDYDDYCSDLSEKRREMSDVWKETIAEELRGAFLDCWDLHTTYFVRKDLAEVLKRNSRELFNPFLFQTIGMSCQEEELLELFENYVKEKVDRFTKNFVRLMKEKDRDTYNRAVRSW